MQLMLRADYKTNSVSDKTAIKETAMQRVYQTLAQQNVVGIRLLTTVSQH